MSDAIQKIDPFLPANMGEAEKLAVRLASSGLLPEALRGKPGDVLVTIITGHELGLSPMQAIRGMHVVKGKAIMSADLAVGLVKRHPQCKWFRLVKSTDEIATYSTLRDGDLEPTTLSFTIQQAKNAQLGGDNWKKYPAAMLRARCSLGLARAVFPDLMLGVYDPDEVPEARVQPERTVAPPPPSRAHIQVVKEQPVEGEIVHDAEPPPFADSDAPPMDEPSDAAEPSPRERACIAIDEAIGNEAAWSALTEKIIGLGMAKDEVVRDYYAKAVKARKAAASR